MNKEVYRLYFAISYEQEFSCSRILPVDIPYLEIIQRFNDQWGIEFDEIYSIDSDFIPILITKPL